MNFKNLSKEVVIDIEQFYIPDIDAKQYDVKSRFLKIKLFNQGKEFNIADPDLSYKFFAIKPDGKEIFNNCTVENGYIVIELTGQTLSVPGKVKSELMITGKNNEVLTTKPFIINVIKSLNSQSAIESKDEYSVIMDLVNELEEYWRIHRYHTIYDVTGTTKTIPINIPEYTSEDSLNVYLNGVRLIEGLEFEIDKTTQPFTIRNLKGDWINGDQLYLEFLRRVKGATTGNVGNGGVANANQVVTQAPIFGQNNVQDILEAIRNLVGGDNLDGLQTNDKTSLINAINELLLKITQLENSKNKFTKNSSIIRLRAESAQISIPVNLNYNHANDVLDVYIAGAKVSIGVDGSCSYDELTNTLNCNNGTWSTGTEIMIEVTKNI